MEEQAVTRWSMPNPAHDLMLPPSDKPLPTCWACSHRFKSRPRHRKGGPKLLGVYCDNCYDRITGCSVPCPERDKLWSNKVDPTDAGQAYMDNLVRLLEERDE